MARFVAGAVFGAALMLVAGAAIGLHAQDPQTDVETAARAAGVDPVDLAGAANSVGVDPWVYARSEGLLESAVTSEKSRPPVVAASPPALPAVSARVACIIHVESKGDPSAHNRSGASGLGQFLPSTWMSTPQGRAGLSVYDAAANRAAIQYMLDAGRAHEFDAVRFYGC
jgi:hypothetical protein